MWKRVVAGLMVLVGSAGCDPSATDASEEEVRISADGAAEDEVETTRTGSPSDEAFAALEARVAQLESQRPRWVDAEGRVVEGVIGRLPGTMSRPYVLELMDEAGYVWGLGVSGPRSTVAMAEPVEWIREHHFASTDCTGAAYVKGPTLKAPRFALRDAVAGAYVSLPDHPEWEQLPLCSHLVASNPEPYCQLSQEPPCAEVHTILRADALVPIAEPDLSGYALPLRWERP